MSFSLARRESKRTETGRDSLIRPSGLLRITPQLMLAIAVAGLFAWSVSRSYFLGDDAFISFRYADHLVRGNGLVWNVGEPVEGYTNFLWVLLMAASLAIGVPPELSSNVIGIASGAALLFAIGRFSIRRNGAGTSVWLLLLILATSRSFGAWCTGGLETMFFTLLVFLAFDRFISESERESQHPYLSGLLFGLASLTRPEGILFSAVAGATLILSLIRGKRTLGAVLRWGAPLALLVGAHFTFRLIYYNEWLPNTFYAKVSGLWLEQSLYYLTLFNHTYQIVWFLPLLLLAVWGCGARVARLFLAVLITYTLYLLYVGGDRFEFRFLVVVFPYLYWLIVEGIRRITHMAPRPSRLRVALRGVAVMVGIGLLASTVWGWSRIVPFRERIGNVDVSTIERYASARTRQGRFLKSLIDRGKLPADLVTAMGGAGAVPYYTRWTTIDRRGLNDATIARMPITRRGETGHEHDAPWEYLVSRKVVVFDIFNALTTRSLQPLANVRAPIHDGRRLRLRAIEIEGRYMLFATFVSDQELARIFEGYEIFDEDDAFR